MTLQKMIKASVVKNGDRIIVEDETTQISYWEMYENSNALGHYLWEKCGEKNVIALMFSDFTFYLYSMVACLLTNNIFMPLDSEYPRRRVVECIKNAGCHRVLTDKSIDVELINYFLASDIEVCYVEEIIGKKNACEDLFDKFEYAEDSPIYIFFTSGSTGTPKGILGKNNSLCNFIDWEIKEFEISNEDRFAQITSPSFDPFLRDVFTPLCSGACICKTNRKIVLFSGVFNSFIRNKKITILHTTPTVLENMLGNGISAGPINNLRFVLLAGEKLSAKTVIEWYRKNKSAQLVNLYGPTETTMSKFFKKIPVDFADDEVAVGRPIPGTCVHVVAEDGKECGNSQIGEIVIQTKYSTYGYINDTLNDSFKELDGETYYSTGDLGYVKNDELYLVGRLDDQKKIGGIRINLNEIANRVTMYDEDMILRCAVLYLNELVAFYISRRPIDERKMRLYLKEYFQNTLIPKKFIRVDSFPMTLNGKLDTKQLYRKYVGNKKN